MSSSSSASQERLALTLRLRRSISRSEITHVGLTSSAALAIYATTQQTWLDTFRLTPSAPLTSLAKTAGSQAVFSPAGDQTATLRDWSVQLGGGVEYHHSTSVLARDVASGKSVLEIKGAGGAGGPVVWSSDGRLIAATEAGRRDADRMGVWEAKTGRRVGRVLSHIDRITHAAFMPDGRLVTISKDGTLRITNPVTSKTLSRLEIDSSNPRALAVSPDGRTVVSIWGSTIHIWHPLSGDLTSYGLSSTRTVEGWPLCISSDCRYIACRTEEGFDIMEVGSGAVVCERSSGDGELVTAGAFAPDASALLVGKMDGALEVWDIAERKK